MWVLLVLPRQLCPIEVWAQDLLYLAPGRWQQILWVLWVARWLLMEGTCSNTSQEWLIILRCGQIWGPHCSLSLISCELIHCGVLGHITMLVIGGEHCIVMRWSMLFTVPVSAVVDRCLLFRMCIWSYVMDFLDQCFCYYSRFQIFITHIDVKFKAV